MNSTGQAIAQQTPVDLHRGFTLNGQQVLPASGEVLLASGLRTLEPKVMAVLLVLARAAGQPVSTEQIFAEVWPRSVYSPMQVRRSINQLRKLFQDTGKSLIRTHPKRGYVLHATIAPLAAANGCQLVSVPGAAQYGPAAANTAARQPIAAGGRRMVVLMFGLLMVLPGLLLSGWWFGLRPAPLPLWQVSALRPLAASAAAESFSQFTPDSRSVLYLKKPHTSPARSELWLAPLDGQPPRLLWQTGLALQFFSVLPAGFNPAQPAEAASGHTVLLVATEQQGQLQFSTLSLDLNQPQPAQSAAAAMPALTPVLSLPDSQLHSPFFVRDNQLYVLVRQAAGTRLLQADLTSGQLRLLLTATDQFNPYRIAPAPAPHIALLGFDQQQRSQLKWLHSGTAGLTTQQTLDHNWYFMAYDETRPGYLLSDGKQLFYLSNNQQLQPLAFENADFLHYPVISPDGRHISYTHARLHGNLFQQPLPAGPPLQLTDTGRHSWQGRYAPDGKQIAYVSNKNGHSQLFVLDLASGQHRLVYANPGQQLALSQPVWSPDGQQLAFAENQQVVLLHLTGRQPQVEYVDQLVGLPTQWLAQPSRLLLKQAGQPASRWLWYDVLTRQQHWLANSDRTQLWCGPHWFERDDRQLWLVQPAPAAGAEVDRPLFVAPAGQRIVQHLVSDAGIYLLLSQRATVAMTTKPDTGNSLWFIPLTSLQAGKIRDDVPTDVDISDIHQQQLLYSTFHSEKDIQTLLFGPAS